MNKKPHICPYCGSEIKEITNSDILKAVGKVPNDFYSKQITVKRQYHVPKTK